MIMINGNWEKVENLSEVVKIVSENIGNEFAKTVKEICEEFIIGYNDILQRLDYLNKQIDKLENYIDENKDGTDFMKGMINAYDMIER